MRTDGLPSMPDVDLSLHAAALTNAAVAHIRDGILRTGRLDHAIRLLETAREYTQEMERRPDGQG